MVLIQQLKSGSVHAAGHSDSETNETNDSEVNDTLEIDFTRDYSEDISSLYGLFVDNQGTGSVYSYMITRQGMDGNDEAVIYICALIIRYDLLRAAFSAGV